MGGSKSKSAKPSPSAPTEPPLPKILLLGSEGSGKTVFIRSLAGYTQQNIYSNLKLETLITRHCVAAFTHIINEMNEQERADMFEVLTDDSISLQKVKSHLCSSPNPSIQLLEEFPDNYLLFVELWNNSAKIREYVKARLFCNYRYSSTNFVNYDKFFSSIVSGRLSNDLLKYIPQRKEPISTLKIKLTDELFNLIDVRKVMSSVTSNRLRKFSEINENARLGIFMANPIGFDKYYIDEDFKEMKESIDLFEELLTYRFTKDLRIVVIFTMADLLIEKLIRSNISELESGTDRVELRRIENLKDRERIALNSIIDRYQNVFEYNRQGERFEYHLINTLSEIECYESLQGALSGAPTIISRCLLGTRFMTNLYKTIQTQPCILSDVNLSTPFG